MLNPQSPMDNDHRQDAGRILTRNNSAALRCFSIPVKNRTKYLLFIESIEAHEMRARRADANYRLDARFNALPFSVRGSGKGMGFPISLPVTTCASLESSRRFAQ